MRDRKPPRDAGASEVGQDVAASGEATRERFHESKELARTYERSRWAYQAARAAFAELQQAHREGRYQGPEMAEFEARSGDLREAVRLTQLKAAAEIERFARSQRGRVFPADTGGTDGPGDGQESGVLRATVPPEP
jgi:hypothetical protein